MADAFARALQYPRVSGVLNIGTGTQTSVNDVYRRLARLTGVGRAAEHGPARPGEQRRSVLDASRAKEALGWTAATPFDAGLARTVEHMRKEVPA